LKTDWKDDIFEGEHRLYRITDAPNGSGKYIEDITSYTQQGDVFGALQLRQIGAEVNRIQNARNVTLTVAGWNGSSAPYEQVIPIEGVTAEDVPGVGVVYPSNCTRQEQKSINKAVSYIYDIETGAGSVTVRATAKPTVSITLGLKGVV